MAAAACGSPGAVPELTATPLPETRPAAEPVPKPMVGGAPDASDADAGRSTAGGTLAATSPTADDEAAAGGQQPSLDAAMAARLAAHVGGARSADHLSADVTADGMADLVTSAVATDDVLTVTLATWDGDEYADSGRITADAVDRAGTPLVRDLDGDGRAELLAPFTTSSGGGVVVAMVADDASLAPPTACPLPAPTDLRLRLRAGKAVSARLTCGHDARPDGGATTVLPWNGRHFTTDPEPPAAGPETARPADPGAADGRRADPDGGGRGEDAPPPGRVDDPQGPGDGPPGAGDGPPGRGDDPPGSGRGPDGDGPPGRGGRD